MSCTNNVNLKQLEKKVSCDCDAAYSKYIRISTMVIVTYVFKREEFEFEFWCLTPLSAIFQLYHGDRSSFSGGGSRSTRREPPTLGKQLVNFITCLCEPSAPFL